MLHTTLRILLAVSFLLSLAVMPARASVVTYTDPGAWATGTGGYAMTTINFDNLGVSPDSSVTYNNSSGLTTGGVQFVGTVGSSHQLEAFNGTNVAGEDFGTGTYLEGPAYGVGPQAYIHTVLPAGTTAISADLMSLSQSGSAAAYAIQIFTSLDGGTNPVLTLTTPSSTSSLAFFGIVSTTPIQWLDIVPEFVYNQTPLVDNYEYGDDPPTPEPVSALLMGSGLLLLAGRRLALKRA